MTDIHHKWPVEVSTKSESRYEVRISLTSFLEICSPQILPRALSRNLLAIFSFVPSYPQYDLTTCVTALNLKLERKIRALT